MNMGCNFVSNELGNEEEKSLYSFAIIENRGYRSHDTQMQMNLNEN